MTIANNFEIGDIVQITEASWEHSSEILHKFNFKRGAAYEVTGVYPSGLISLKGATATYYPDYFELAKTEMTQEVKPDAVNKPKHYAVFEQLEAIEVIASSMNTEQFYGYCLGNILKYRLRAGGKDDVMQELGKADRYQGLYNEFKHLCKAA